MSHKSIETLFYDASSDKFRASTPVDFDDKTVFSDFLNNKDLEKLDEDDEEDFWKDAKLDVNTVGKNDVTIEDITENMQDIALSDVSSDFDVITEKFIDSHDEDDQLRPIEKVPTVEDVIAQLPIDDPLLLSMKYGKQINQNPEAKVSKIKMIQEFTDLPIFIAEIFSPSHFWCHIAYSSAVQDMNYNFDVFSKKFNQDYKSLKKQDLQFSKEKFKEKIGLIAAGYLSAFKTWYRVKITNYYDDTDIARVYCIDFGTKGFLKRSRLKYLFQDYMDYPEFCFRGRLYGLKPFDNMRYFKSTQVEKFIAEVSSKLFLAKLERYDEVEDVYEMSLIRNCDGIDMKLLALFENIGIEIDEKEYDSKISLGPACYLLPTFDILEQGNYPRYVDFYEFEANETDYNLAIDTNFFHAVTFTESEKREDIKTTLKSREFRKIHKYFYNEDI